MKKSIKILFTILLAGLLLWSCGTAPADETDTMNKNDVIQTEASTDMPELTPAKHTITTEKVQSLLAANGLQTNLNRYVGLSEAAAYHGGQQMRVVHTERGIYTAFAKDSGDNETGIQQFYVAKVDNDNHVTLLHYGEFTSDHNEILVNIAQDTNGDIIVTVASKQELEVHVFDHETDAMTKYAAVPNFTSEDSPSYTQAMFDFANRKIYTFANDTDHNGGYLLEWFTFDLESMEWNPDSLYTWLPVGRHCYLYPFPDGKGGAYILGQRTLFHDDPLAAELKVEGTRIYTWDELRLFYIPDLSSTENIEYTTVQKVYSERGDEGIWSFADNNQHGDVFIDAEGYMHITYVYYLSNYSGTHENFDNALQYRYAIYDGLECIYNEELVLSDPDFENYDINIMQDTDKNLYLIACKQLADPLQLEIYKAEGALGSSWELVKTIVLPEPNDGIQPGAFSTSAVRDGSVQDNTVSCFFYYYGWGAYVLDYTPYVFNLSLEDYSITEPIGILHGFDLEVDGRVDERVPASAHQNKVIHTENGTYAAFVYNHIGRDSTDQFHIVKIENDNTVKILHSDSFTSEQNVFLTMYRAEDGTIYVFPPTGNTVYTISTETDAVTLHKTTEKRIPAMLAPQQTDFFTDAASGTNYVISIRSPKAFAIERDTFDPETVTISGKATKYTFDKELTGSYSAFYTLADTDGSVYMVATRQAILDRYNFKGELSGKLNYNGHTESVSDSIMLFYIDNLGENDEIQCIDVQLPNEDRGDEGIWSVVNVADNGDVYLDSEGKLHIFYTCYYFDFDDVDRKSNPALIDSTLKHYHAVYAGTELVSLTEVGIDGLTTHSFLRMAETTDDTPYLLVCNNDEEGARLDVYFETENGWVLTQTKRLGDFTAESFSISSPKGGSVQDNVIDCIIYAADNDVYYTSVIFE